MEGRKDYLALVETAKLAAQSSYAPYSNLAQGAALLSVDGRVFSGSKMECAAYSGTVAAETAALTAAVTAGVRKFVAIAVHPSQFPCGTSRQMLVEFGIDLDVVLENDDGGEISVTSLRDLLPLHFGPDNLS